MKKILVIDDERDVLELVRSVLKTKGYSVRCAEGGEEGLREAEEEKPDLIISDLMMPKISGRELVKRIKNNDRLKDVPIIVLSAVGSESDKDPQYWAAGLGVDEFISKPFDPLDLLGRVEYLFRRKGYVSSGAAARPTPKPVSEEQESQALESQVDEQDLKEMTPTEVAQTFVKSWNKKDWATEYQLMDADIVAHFNLDQYANSRENTYATERRTQQPKDVIEEKVSQNAARVVLKREDQIPGGQTREREVSFVMKKTHKGWKILRFTEK